MRKVFFTNTLMEGCMYVRSLVPMRAGGWDGDKTNMRSPFMNNDEKARACLASDVIVFHRPNDERALQIAELLRKQGKKIVMDNDDTYKGFNLTKMGKLADKFGQVDKALDLFANQADMVTCTTEFLRQEYLKLNPNVVVLPNCVDPEDWPSVEEIGRNEGEKVRIGLVGSVGLHHDIEEFNWVLDELVKRKDVQIVVFALPGMSAEEKEVREAYKPEIEFWNKYNVEWQHFVHIKDYIETLNNLKLDLMLIPRQDIYFNRCKSNLKFLEASMLEIPVVAQGFTTGDSPYQVDPEDTAHLKLVTDNTKWMEEIEPLIQSKELRQEQGRKAREYVIKKYDIHNNIHKWVEAYESLYK